MADESPPRLPARPRRRDEFRIAIICALPAEAEMVELVLDKDWSDDSGKRYGKAPGDHNTYTTGVIASHNVVLTHMSNMGTNSAAATATGLRLSFRKLEFAFVVGICGTAPVHPDTHEEIVLGDSVIGTAVVQYDLGKQYPNRFARKASIEDSLGRACPEIRSLIAKLKTTRTRRKLSERLSFHLGVLQESEDGQEVKYPGADEDKLFEPSYVHCHRSTTSKCEKCLSEIDICMKDCSQLGCESRHLIQRKRLQDGNNTPRIHFGRFGSANTVMRSGVDRDKITLADDIAAFDMEGSGIWDSLPTVVIKSACDYADSHQNKKWQKYAAASAAATLKALLERLELADEEMQSQDHVFALSPSRLSLSDPEQNDPVASMLADVEQRTIGRTGEFLTSENSRPPAVLSSGRSIVGTHPNADRYQDDDMTSFTAGTYGIRVLVDPGQADVDIIFVHGLTGNRETTWSSKALAPWPQSFLPTDLPTARVLTFGYDADLVRAIDITSSNTVRDHGSALATDLARLRVDSACENRPIIWIAHSLGGLVCEQALLISRGASENWLNAILDSTAGIIFIGTPHAGSNLIEWAHILTNLAYFTQCTNKALLEVLQPGSEMLATIQQEFHRLLDQRQKRSETVPDIYCFFEELAMRRTGPVVPKHSAILPRYGNQGIHANHINMTKFKNDSDPGYKAITGQLRIWVRDIAHGGIQAGGQVMPKSSRTFMIPFSRDQHFTGREEILHNLRQQYNTKRRQFQLRLALVGTGGVGKSQIAIEHAYRTRDLYPMHSVFWIHGSSSDRFKQGYREIASRKNIEVDDESKILEIIHEWLSEESHGPWTMIIDNIDDDTVFTCAHHGHKALRDYIPVNPNGFIIVTTRYQSAAINIVGINNTIDVGPMLLTESLNLLRSKIPSTEDFESSATDLVQSLELLPLAIVHAAAYISVRMCSIVWYLKLFENEKSQRMLLNDSHFQDTRQDTEASRTIAATWQISFNLIRKDYPEAASMLCMLSMFDAYNIPSRLLGKPDATDTKNTETDMVNPVIEAQLAPLLSYSLIMRGSSPTTVKMHRLVQLSVVQWLEGMETLRYHQEIAILCMALHFPSAEFKHWGTCQELLPHATKVIQYDTTEETDKGKRQLMSKVMWYLHSTRNHAEALKLGEWTIMLGSRLLGEDPVLGTFPKGDDRDKELLVDVLETRVLFGRMQLDCGLFEEAERTLRDAVKIYEKLDLLDQKISAIEGQISLARALSSLGKYDTGARMFRMALRSLRRSSDLALLWKHDVKLNGMEGLALCLSAQAQYQPAQELLGQVLKGRHHYQGLEHPDTIGTLQALSSVFADQSMFEEQEPMIKEARIATEHIYGANQEISLTRLSEVIVNSYRRSDFDEALELNATLMETGSLHLGKDHPLTQASIGFNQLILAVKDRYNDLDSLHQELLRRTDVQFHPEILPLSHEEVVSFAETRCSNLEAKAKYQVAEPLRREILAASFYDDQSSIVNNQLCLASNLYNQAKYTEAQEFFETALESKEVSERSGDAIRQQIATQLQLTLVAQQNNDAVRALEKTYGLKAADMARGDGSSAIQRSARDINHFTIELPSEPTTEELAVGKAILDMPAFTPQIPNIGPWLDHCKTLEQQGSYSEAEPLLRHVLRGYKHLVGPKAAETIKVIRLLAQNLQMQQRWKNAANLYRKVLHWHQNRPESDSGSMEDVMCRLCRCLEQQNLWSEAEPLWRHVLGLRTKNLGASDPDTHKIAFRLGRNLVEQEKLEEAEAIFWDLLAVARLRQASQPRRMIEATNWLCSILENQDRFPEAEPLWRELLDKQELAYGFESANTFRTINDLGQNLAKQRRFSEALELFERALEPGLYRLGTAHSDLMEELAMGRCGCLYHLDRKIEAEQWAALYGLTFMSGIEDDEQLFKDQQIENTANAVENDTITETCGPNSASDNEGKAHQPETEADAEFLEVEQTFRSKQKHPKTEVFERMILLGVLDDGSTMDTLAEADSRAKTDAHKRSAKQLPFRAFKNLTVREREKFDKALIGPNNVIMKKCKALHEESRYAEAEPLLYEALAQCDIDDGIRSIPRTLTLAHLTINLFAQGRLEEAEALLAKELKPFQLRSWDHTVPGPSEEDIKRDPVFHLWNFLMTESATSRQIYPIDEVRGLEEVLVETSKTKSRAKSENENAESQVESLSNAGHPTNEH